MTLSLDLLMGFALFALVTSITPGPNNTMLLASGLNFGFNRTIPHMLGITCGFFVLVVAVGFGLARRDESPHARDLRHVNLRPRSAHRPTSPNNADPAPINVPRSPVSPPRPAHRRPARGGRGRSG